MSCNSVYLRKSIVSAFIFDIVFLLVSLTAAKEACFPALSFLQEIVRQTLSLASTDNTFMGLSWEFHEILHFDNRSLYSYKDLSRTLHQLWHCPRYFLRFSFWAFYDNHLAHQNSVYFFPLQRPIIGFRVNSSVWPVENNVPLMIFKHS